MDTHNWSDIPEELTDSVQTFSDVPTLDQLLSSRPPIQSPSKPKQSLHYTPARQAANAAKQPRDAVTTLSSTSRTDTLVSQDHILFSGWNSARRERRTTAYWRSVGMFVEDSEAERGHAALLIDSESEDTGEDYGSRYPPMNHKTPLSSKALTGQADLSSDDSLPSIRELLISPKPTSMTRPPDTPRQRNPTKQPTSVKQVEVIELLSSDDEAPPPAARPRPAIPPRPPPTDHVDEALSSSPDDNEGMLFFEASRRPAKKAAPKFPSSSLPRQQDIFQTPSTRSVENIIQDVNDDCILRLSSSDDEPSTPPRKAPTTPRPRRTPAKSATTTPRKTPGRGKKALQAQLEQLAEDTVSQLNSRVFGGKIPPDIQLIWSKRLNTTAGRANWKRIRKENGDDIHQCSIELSTKVLDNEERVLNTVAHELCHLACWVIDGEIQPAHGRAFKAWGRKVMRCRPDIEVTTKHDYEIAYKYEWRCTNPICGKTYGRHSKSINPDQHVCGGCKGKLEPMFQTCSPSKRTAFQEYLKEHMKDLKAAEPGMSHKELMQELSRRFKAEKAKAASNTDDLIERMGALTFQAGTDSPRMPGAS